MKVIALVGEKESLGAGALSAMEALYSLLPLQSIAQLFEVSFSAPPDLILFNAEQLDPAAQEALSHIKADPLCAHIPMVGMCRLPESLSTSGLASLIDDFINLPLNDDELIVRLGLNMERSRKTKSSLSSSNASALTSATVSSRPSRRTPTADPRDRAPRRRA